MLWAAVALVTCWSQAPYFVHSLWPPRDVVTDFFQEWASARNVLGGLPAYAGHRETIIRYMGRLDPDSVVVEVNAHPPTSILLALPFAALPYFEALFVWNLASLAALGASLWLVARGLGLVWKAEAVFPLVALLALCNPLLQQIWLGQLNLVLLLLLTGAWAADRAHRPWTAGALVGAAMAIKLFPGFLLIYFALRRNWKALAAAAIALCALTALTLVALGAGAYLSYFRDALPRVQAFQSWWNNSSLTGLAKKLFGPPTPRPWLVWRVEPLWNWPLASRVVPLLLSLGIVALLCRSVPRSKTRAAADRAFALSLTAMLLVSPITWEHYFVLLLVPLAIAWVQLPAAGWARVLLLAIVAALWLPPAAYDTLFLGPATRGEAVPLRSLLWLALPCYALLGLFVLLSLEVPQSALGRAGNVPDRAAVAPAHENGSPNLEDCPADVASALAGS